MTKKIISIITAVFMLASALPTFAAKDTDTALTAAENFALGISAFDGEYTSDKEMTRAEFAAFVANLSGLMKNSGEKWREEAFADDNKDELLGNTATAFADVSGIHKYYDEIMAVCTTGYMHGISENKFAPDYGITVGEAVKVFMDMMSYNVRADALGGYPNGYMAVARENGILRGVNGASSKLTCKEAARLLYNALDVPIFSVTSINSKGSTDYETDKNETFMTEILKLDKLKGRLTDNGITALTGKSEVGKGYIKVDDKKLSHTADLNGVKKFIGRKVCVYYGNDTDNEDELAYFTTEDDDDILTVDMKNVSSITKQGTKLVINYEENDKEKSETIAAKTGIVYNNKAMTSYTEDLFDFNSGNITLIATDDAEYNLAVVNRMEFMTVEKIDKDDVVYGKGKGTNVFSTLDLSADTVDYLKISDENGDTAAVSSIVEGDTLNVVKSTDGKAVEVVINRNKINGVTVKTKSSENNKSIISDGETEYDVTITKTLSNAPAFLLGLTYDLNLNIYGDVVWAEETKTETSTELLGIVMTSGSLSGNELKEDYAVKIYTEKGEGVMYRLADKVALNRNGTKKAADTVTVIAAAQGEPVLYELNEDGKIKSVIIAAAYGADDDERGWYRINPKAELGWNGSEYVSESKGTINDKNGNPINVSKQWYLYHGDGSHFSTWMYYVKGSTKVFTVPGNDDDLTNEKKYTVGKKGFSNDTFYAVDGFARDINAMEAEVLSMRMPAKGGGTINTQEAFFIESKTKAYDAEESEEVIRLTGWYFKNNDAVHGTLDLSTDAVMVDEAEIGTEIDPSADENTVGPRTVDELESGDIVGYSIGGDGKASVLRILYDVSTGKEFTGRKLALSGNAGYAYYTNASGVEISKEKPEISAMMPGTTAEVPTAGTYLMNNLPMRRFRITAKSAVVTVKKDANGRWKGQKGSINDIKSYNDTSSVDDYDRVAVLTVRHALNFGTVIYKNN